MIEQLLKSNQLIGNSKITTLFLNKGICNFYDAVVYINTLPYGRNTDRDDCTLVLKEACGTCSTKHALLKELAVEQKIDLQLMLGIFLMDKINTPAITHVLDLFKISALPEAHCFLKLGDQRFDVTFPGSIFKPDPMSFLLEEKIDANQIGHYKIQWHQKFIKEWLKKEKLALTFNEIWECREKCINVLSQQIMGLRNEQ